MYVAVNTLFRHREDPTKIERIVWLDESNQASFIVDINRNHYPAYMSLVEIFEGLNSGTYIIEETDPWMRIIDEESLSKSEKESWDRAWNVIQWMIQNRFEPNIFIPKQRSQIIKQASQAFGLSEIAVSKYVKKYYIRGLTRYALLPDQSNCGGKGKRRGDGQGSKRGRKRKNPSIYSEMNINEEVKQIFRRSLDKHYYQKNRPSLRYAYEQMIRENFATAYRMENGVKIPVIENGAEIPSFGQFRYWFENWRDVKKEIILREGKKKYEQQYRPVLGSTKQDAMGPGSLYQIDATIGDIYLVSSYDRSKIIGRPTIYFICDAYSRLVVGVYIGLENASWNGAMMAMENAFLKSKVDFCRRYGIDIKEEDWPGGIPTAILGDRGELISDKALSVIENLNIAVKNTASYRPELKSVVEKQFDLIQSQIAPFIKGGGIQSDFRERGATDYRLHSTLTLFDYSRIVIKTVLYFNNQHHLSGYERDAMQIAQNVPPIPIRLWEFGMKNHSGKLRHVPPNVLRFNLMPQGLAVVTQRGIRFNGIYYGSEIALKQRWFTKARSSGLWEVPVNYDPRNVSNIYLRLSRTEFEVCYLLESQSRYKDQTLDDVNYLLEWEQKEHATYEEKELGDRISLAAEIESIVQDATRKTRAEQTAQSKTAKLKGIRMNRDAEKQKNRESEMFVLGREELPNSSKPKESEEDDFMFDEIQLLRKKQKEGLRGNHD
ncbi:Mu transposase C-terminal domain-containing protein [Paenibacillus chartarius]|uniref:Mu transposase C-terminal domain-containing protein n=1 Tax=Paenibacillus chartarius TaxID=747481 RepID=A0ABV6DHK2_9BACL